jgi:hypothetical protein
MVERRTYALEPSRPGRRDPAEGCSSRSRHAELLILCARIGFNP